MFSFLFILWIAIAIGFAVAEMISITFYMMPFSLGGAVAFVALILGAPPVLQFVLFITVSIVALVLLRPFAKRVTRKSPEQTSAIDRFADAVGVITQPVEAPGGYGRVTVLGEDWLCAALDPDDSCAVGTKVTVDHVDGTKLIVVPCPEC